MVFLLFFRARHAFFTRYEHADDGCYVHWLNTFVGLPQEGCTHGSYLPGTAVVWLPAGIIGRWLAAFTDMPHRPYFDVLIGLTAFACWGVSLSVLHRMDRRGAWVFLLNVPVLYYCTSHTHIAHAAELLLMTLFLYAIEKRALGAAAFLTAWLALTRVNDAGVVLILMGSLIDARRLNRTAILASCAVIAFAAVMACGLGYNGDTVQSIFWRNRLSYFTNLLFGAEAGVVWSMSYFLALLGWGVYRWRALTWAARGAIAFFVATLYVAMLMGPGNDFGQRYTIGACVAMFMIHRAAPLRPWAGLAFCGAIWMTLQTWVYQTPPYEVPMQVRTALRLIDPMGLVRPLALSPGGMLVFSAFHDSAVFAKYREFSSAALYGVRLWALVAATVAALIAVSSKLFRWWKWRRPLRATESPS